MIEGEWDGEWEGESKSESFHILLCDYTNAVFLNKFALHSFKIVWTKADFIIDLKHVIYYTLSY